MLDSIRDSIQREDFNDSFEAWANSMIEHQLQRQLEYSLLDERALITLLESRPELSLTRYVSFLYTSLEC